MSIPAIIPDYHYWKSQIKCLSNCPVNTDARAYIQAIEENDFERAYLIARSPNPLASICGRICGSPCEINCRRKDLDSSVSIRALKRVITEEYAFRRDIRPGYERERMRDHLLNRFSRHRSGSIYDIAALRELAQSMPAGPVSVGILGGGPAGLACAHDLAILGHRPVVYEAERVAAGMLFLGVPAYRLPRDVILAEIELIKILGVELQTGIDVGRDVSLAEIRRRHDKTVIAVGAKRSRSLPVPGIRARGVFGGVEFLRDVALGNPVEIGQQVLVIGGGNVAYDVSRTAVRNTEEDVARSAIRQPFVRSVTLCCLESLDEMPADMIEIKEAEEEGVRRLNRLGPKEILTDREGRVRGVVFQKVLSVFDDQGRFAPKFDPEMLTEIEADTVILSVGQRADLSFLRADDGVMIGGNGLPVHDSQTHMTSAPGVYVTGDVACGTQLMIHAIASGKKVALAIHAEAAGRNLAAAPSFRFQEISPYVRSLDYHTKPRLKIPKVAAERRLAGVYELVEIGYTHNAAREEARRCLRCSIHPVFNSERCVLCGGCVDACPHACLSLVQAVHLDRYPKLMDLFEKRYGSLSAAMDGSVILKDDTLCIRCGICAARCPVGAISMEQILFEESITDAR